MSAERVWLCWSCSRQAFHIEGEAEGCKINLHGFVLNRANDFVPLAVFPSRQAASDFARQIEAIRDERRPKVKQTEVAG